MKVITVRNVHQALPVALRLLRAEGLREESRNGPVIVYPEPVATVYTHPCERVMFWPERDANPFFHLYESLWMLAGRDDIAPLTRYAKQMAEYSDDGVTQHGAYGYRWRHAFNVDQLEIIIDRLSQDPTDRRCVLQMWSTINDLDVASKDLPCNTTATVQIRGGRLELTVFCRSNDIVWGCYGANAVHFSMLLEYLALRIGVPVGTYTQVSVNWHGYTSVLDKLAEIPIVGRSRYETLGVRVLPMDTDGELDAEINGLLETADTGFSYWPGGTPWLDMVYYVLLAHHLYKTIPGMPGLNAALAALTDAPQDVDWVVVAREWLMRRRDRRAIRDAREGETLGEA